MPVRAALTNSVAERFIPDIITVQPDLTDIERGALRDFLARPEPVRLALEKYAAQRKVEMERGASDCLRGIPRQLEQAVDYAAKAEVYGQLLKDLQRFSDK
jgi:hypothetical protein